MEMIVLDAFLAYKKTEKDGECQSFGDLFSILTTLLIACLSLVYAGECRAAISRSIQGMSQLRRSKLTLDRF